jgi:16S rRNA C967 or C1407 C5-methylase (RsmB/RsmF family)
MRPPKVSPIERVAAKLGLSEDEAAEWVAALESGPGRWVAEIGPQGGSSESRPSWFPEFVRLVSRDSVAPDESYRLDPSSVFMAAPFLGLDNVDSVLDVCAAPGGKSILAWSGLFPGRMVSNEIDARRARKLAENLSRLNVLAEVTCLRPGSLEGEFDLVIVDAPCSGQSMLAKGKRHPGCFYPSIVNGCAMRQRRILAESAERVATGGYLAYMTCTFSLEENEEVVAWFLSKFRGWEAEAVQGLAGHESRLAPFPCYRDWPHRGPGSGGFTALLRRGP